MDAAPKQLLDRLNMKRKAFNVQGGPYDQTVYDARAVVVSLNPDVVIISLGERKPPRQPGELDKLFADWDEKGGRWQMVRKSLDWFGFWLGTYGAKFSFARPGDAGDYRALRPRVTRTMPDRSLART